MFLVHISIHPTYIIMSLELTAKALETSLIESMILVASFASTLNAFIIAIKKLAESPALIASSAIF